MATLEERLTATRRGDTHRTPIGPAQLLLELVAHLDEHDPLTRGHSERVRGYAQSIGRELGLDSRELDLLNWAALLHDIGKLAVPHEILASPRRPTEDEWEILRTHPTSGAELAAPLREWLGTWSAAIEQHHEQWDGTGYPLGLAGSEISLAGRIVAVADVFDVITSARSYKRQSSVVEARKELLRCAGTQFDPAVVRAFLAISVRQSRLAAPLAWLAHVGMLARLPVTRRRPVRRGRGGGSGCGRRRGRGVGRPSGDDREAAPAIQTWRRDPSRLGSPPPSRIPGRPRGAGRRTRTRGHARRSRIQSRRPSQKETPPPPKRPAATGPAPPKRLDASQAGRSSRLRPGDRHPPSLIPRPHPAPRRPSTPGTRQRRRCLPHLLSWAP